MNGQRLRALRQEVGLSQEKLAERIYVTKYIIQSWEEGWHIINPSSGEIEEMAEIFGISEEQLRLEIDAPEKNDFDYEK